ncbi:MAG: histidine kinase, partial [Acidobacteriota bacterium]|nr:histidine kinase [Acidobacteriota bacterium]
ELSSQIKEWIHVIRRDRTGNLWFGSEGGLYCLRDGKLTRFGTQDGLPSEHIRVIHEDRAGTLWIGTVGGLARRMNNRFHSFGNDDGITPARISSLYEDAAGFLWVGTYDGVLYRLTTDSEKPQVVRFATEQGLPYDAIHKILEDDYGFFWIGGQRGIYRLRRQELDEVAVGKSASVILTKFGKDDGLLTPSCNSWGQPAGFKSPDGKLWFPTEEGIAVIDPKDLPFNPTPPPVLVEDCLIDNQPVSCQSGLQINPGQENLEINYVALSFIKPEQMRFKYKLEGLDSDWNEAGTRRTAYYSHIPPGDYVFRVLAANSNGVWNETGESLAIKVMPPFYRAWWFSILCVFGVALVAYGVYRVRVSRLEHARQAQEEFSRRLINAHEAERRRVAAELHDSIGQTLSMIKNRAVFGTQTTENLAAAHEQFDAITAQTTQAIGEVREISYNLRPYLLDNLGLTKAIKSLVNKIEEVHLLTIDAQICDVDNLFAPEAEMSVYRIVQESLNNVAKHAEADEAALTIEKTNGIVTIKIADNGRGFDKNALPKTDAEKGGFGLLGIAERVRMLGGSLDIQTAIGKGTKLTIKIAVKGKIIKGENWLNK